VLKRELHTFAGGLDRAELRSATEFAVLAFVVYPLLPAEEMSLFGVAFPPRVAWLMVVTVAGIGIANYALVRTYGGRGVAITGFFGGLASSTAVVGSMLDHVRQRESVTDYAVAAVLLALQSPGTAAFAGDPLVDVLGRDTPLPRGVVIELGVRPARGLWILGAAGPLVALGTRLAVRNG